MRNLCNYCFNSRTIELPSGEELSCPICLPWCTLREGYAPDQIILELSGEL